MTAPTVEVAIHGLTDHRPEFVYAVRDERALLGVGFFAEGYTGILSWLDGPTRDTVVHSRMVAVLFVDGDAAGGRPSDVGWEDRILISLRWYPKA